MTSQRCLTIGSRHDVKAICAYLQVLGSGVSYDVKVICVYLQVPGVSHVMVPSSGMMWLLTRSDLTISSISPFFCRPSAVRRKIPNPMSWPSVQNCHLGYKKRDMRKYIPYLLSTCDRTKQQHPTAFCRIKVTLKLCAGLTKSHCSHLVAILTADGCIVCHMQTAAASATTEQCMRLTSSKE